MSLSTLSDSAVGRLLSSLHEGCSDEEIQEVTQEALSRGWTVWQVSQVLREGLIPRSRWAGEGDKKTSD